MFSSKDIFFGAQSGEYRVTNSLRFRGGQYLNRTFGTPTNNKIWTWSGWVKRGSLGSSLYNVLFDGYVNDNNRTCITFNNDTIRFFNMVSSSNTTALDTIAVYRDPSAWYHIVVAVNTTESISSNRVKIYVNNSQVSFSGTPAYPSLNDATLVINAANLHEIGRQSYSSPSSYFDGYMAEVNFIDGQALTPSSFGAYDINGVWQPARYTGTYGTNGFYLPFSNTTSTTTLVADSSGQGNNWTPNNISLTAGTTYDSMIDSPTNYADGGNGRGNYCVLNPLNTTVLTLAGGNLNASYATNSDAYCTSTFRVSSGKWYWECDVTSVGGTYAIVGVASDNAASVVLGSTASTYSYISSTGNKYNNGVATAYGNTYTSGDVIAVALDMDNGKLYFGKISGGAITWQNSGDPVAGTNAAFTSLSGNFTPAINGRNTSNVSLNCGQRPFSASSLPSNFLALNTQNLTTPTIANGAQYMAAVKYDGSGSSQNVVATINNSGNNQLPTTFQPDFVWVKDRSATGANAQNHKLTDSVRGVTKGLITSAPNGTDAETTDANGVTAFLSNGFTVGTGTRAYSDSNADTYIAWQWQAGGAPTTDNVAGAGNVPTAGSVKINGSNSTSTLAGSIAATRISANTSAGFSVVTYTGTGANATVGHGLNAIPSMIIVRNRDTAGSNWPVYHTTLTGTKVIYLNLTNASSTTSTFWNNTDPTNSVFSVGTNTDVNENTKKLVAYCFAPVAGYSAFGSYTGNGLPDGPFVFTGFRPRWIMIKRSSTFTSGYGDWYLYDTSRMLYNVTNTPLYPNTSGAESPANTAFNVDILSNGFKVLTTYQDLNLSGTTYIYAAFAETPFKYSRAR